MVREHNSDHPREAAACTCLAVVFGGGGGIASGIPWFLCSTAMPIAPVLVQALPVQCHHIAGIDLGCGSLETTVFDMLCL